MTEKFKYKYALESWISIPGYQRFFLACGRGALFRRPQAEDASGEAFRAGHFLRQDQNRKPRMKSLWHPG